MRRIAIINQKGGVGKTTTTVSLGAALAAAGARVLLIDLDPQAHLTLHFGVELAEDAPTIYDVLTGGATIAETARPIRGNLTVVPADIDLAGAEAELVSVTGRELLLREAVDSAEMDHDYLLIDCPPSLGVLTVNALVACREVLIPLQAQFFALQGLGKLLDTVTLVRQRINSALAVSGVLLCMHDASTRLANEVVSDLRQFLDESRGQRFAWSNARVYETRIRRNIKLAEAPSFGQTVFEYAPRSNGAIDYAALANEIFGIGPEVDATGADETSRAEADVSAPMVQTDPPVGPPASTPCDGPQGESHAGRESGGLANPLVTTAAAPRCIDASDPLSGLGRAMDSSDTGEPEAAGFVAAVHVTAPASVTSDIRWHSA